MAVTMNWKYRLAAPGKQTGSEWNQTLVFPAGKPLFSLERPDHQQLRMRQHLSCLPAHRHMRTATSSTRTAIPSARSIWSYFGKIAPPEFSANFTPDEKFNYRRDANPQPKRFIRAYHLRDPKNGRGWPLARWDDSGSPRTFMQRAGATNAGIRVFYPRRSVGDPSRLANRSARRLSLAISIPSRRWSASMTNMPEHSGTAGRRSGMEAFGDKPPHHPPPEDQK